MIMLLGFQSDSPEGGNVEYEVTGDDVLRLAQLIGQPGVSMSTWHAVVNFFHEPLTDEQIAERFERRGGKPGQEELFAHD